MKLDLEKVLKDKKPKMSPILAKPLLWYLKRIVHQKRINEILSKHDFSQPPIEFVRTVLREMEISYKVHGLENLDPNKRYIFASNHPFGGMDGIMLAEIVINKFSDAKVVVNDLLMNIDPVRPLFLPVNKLGRQKPEYAKIYKDAMGSNLPIITFPAGMCSRKTKGIVADTKWHPTFIKNAIEYQRDIVPVFFEGKLSRFFYNLHNIRTKLGIKANIEMLYLADEMNKQQGKSFDVYFSDPISYKQIESEGTPKQWCEKIRNISYSLKK